MAISGDRLNLSQELWMGQSDLSCSMEVNLSQGSTSLSATQEPIENALNFSQDISNRNYSFIDLTASSNESLQRVVESSLSIVPAQEKRTDEQLFADLETKTKLLTIKMLEPCQANHRFTNIECPANTAIQLEGTQKTLHANKVQVKGSQIDFVASQAPMNIEIATFWKAICAGSYAIFDITTPKDYQITTTSPATKYWPESSAPLKLAALTITLESTEGYLRTYQVSVDNVTKKIQRYHFSEWPDFGSIDIKKLAELVDGMEKVQNPNIWVHCRAGVGRTGTLITSYFVKEKITKGEIRKDNLDNSLMALILDLRQQRGPGFVQTAGQLGSIRDYAKSLLYPN
jgi:protein tyrosine phosphatase